MALKYKELEKQIQELIKNHNADQSIPSERELAELFGASRMTVRKAIESLVARGFLYKIVKKGTFVANNKFKKVYNDFMGFTQEVEDAGGRVGNNVISFEEIIADSDIAENLAISEGAPVYKLLRLRYKDKVPFMLDESYFPKEKITLDENIVRKSIYNYIEDTLKLKISSSDQELIASHAPDEYLEYLDIEKYEPIMIIKSQSYLQNGDIFEYAISYKNSKYYKIFVKAVRL